LDNKEVTGKKGVQSLAKGPPWSERRHEMGKPIQGLSERGENFTDRRG